MAYNVLDCFTTSVVTKMSEIIGMYLHFASANVKVIDYLFV